MEEMTGIRIDPNSSIIGEKEPENNRPNQPQNPSSSGSIEQWFSNKLNEIQETEKKQTQEPKIIPKVPQELRVNDQKWNCFNPLVVSIGPYHHKKLELKRMEELKFRMADRFIKVTSKKSIQDLYSKVENLASSAKKCYDLSSKEDQLNDEEFTRIMFLDGCFILQFIDCVTSDDANDYESLKMSDQTIGLVRRDLFLLENQLPYQVLDTLMSENNEEWEEKINKFVKLREPKSFSAFMISLLFIFFVFLYCLLSVCSSCCKQNAKPRALQDPEKKPITTKEKRKAEPNHQPVHLLQHLYDKLIDKKTKLYKAKTIHGQYLYSSAKYLKKMGIHFRKSKSVAFTDVNFSSTPIAGTLYIPPLTIDESTKSTLLNLVAYEKCLGESIKPWATSYICFMDSLIDDADDVKELRSKGILVNFFGTDQQVAELFKLMASPLVPNPDAHIDIKSSINKQCESIIAQWVAEFGQTYFRNPWTFIAFVGASVALILTFIQTYLAIHPPNN